MEELQFHKEIVLDYERLRIDNLQLREKLRTYQEVAELDNNELRRLREEGRALKNKIKEISEENEKLKTEISEMDDQLGLAYGLNP